MSAAPDATPQKPEACTRCDEASQERLCEGCARECYGIGGDSRDDELEDVLEFFKQLAIDAERCGRPIDVQDVATRLERGEHHV